MLRLLRLISWPQLRQSWGRTALVVVGIANGVTLIVAINIINSSVLANVRHTIELMAGPASLEVTLGVGEIGFPEHTVDGLRGDPDVVAAVPLVRGTVSLASEPSETLQLFGADFTAEEELRRYDIGTTDRRTILEGMADAHSILVTNAFAERHGLKAGAILQLSTPSGIGAFTVRGLLEPEGLAKAFRGQLAVMDLPAAQLALGKAGLIDQIDIVVREGASIDTVRERLIKKVPPSLSVERPEQRGVQYERILGSFQAMLTGLSMLCLVAGIFIVYNTTSTGAAHRAGVMAALRVAGASGDQLFRLLMVEAVVLGTVATLIGFVQGVVLAWLLSPLVSESMGVIFQLRFPVDGLALNVTEQLSIFMLGVSATMFASYFAARRVTRMDPLEVMRSDLRSLATQRPSLHLVGWWAALVAMSAAALVIQVRLRSIAWGNFGSTLWFASSIIVAVPLVALAGRMLSRVLPRVFGSEGRVAAESVFRSPVRTGVTVAAIALVLTIAIGLASIALSFRTSVKSYFGSGFLSSDLIVSAVTTEGGWLETPLPEQLASEIRDLPGVASIELLRVLPGQMFRGERIAIAGLSDGLVEPSRHPAGWYRSGDAVSAAAAIRAGEGARISTSLADRFDLKVGDDLELATPTGPLHVAVVGVVPDYMSDRGGVGISGRLLAERWKDASVNRISVFVSPGESVEAVRQRILDRFGTRYRLKILSLDQLVQFHDQMINRAFAFTDAIQLLVMIVAIAGIFDLLLSAILERRRELALWQVIGADRRTIRRSVVLEAGTIGAFGALLGVAVGLVTAWIWVDVNFRYLLGYYLDYDFALGATVWYVSLTVLMAMIAGYLAANQATRQSVLDGIRQS
ncbi:MAG TPA: FtsX-like permease family protein [Candidatus Binatia bacterium]